MAARAKPNEIRLTRVYDAPARTVWDAWTVPEQVAQWWGPRGFSITTQSKDLREGGSWRYTMHGPDGVDYPNITTYHVVEPHQKLVYDHGATDETPPLFRVTVTFAEEQGRTTMELTMAVATPEAAVEIGKRIKQHGGNATWDRLAEHLNHGATGKETFVINRSFKAPIAKMWSLWTNPEHVCQWLPPTGATMRYLEADIRAGGKARYVMTTDSGLTMYGRAQYVELTAPHRLVYSQQFCDEHGNLARHPLAPTWPATMLTTVTLSEEDAEWTRVTVKWELQGDVTAEELATFIHGRTGMTGGWTGSFDKLEAILEG